MAEKDISLYGCSISPPVGRSVSPPPKMMLAVAFGAALMLGCSGQHAMFGNVSGHPPSPFIDSQVDQATHPAEEPVLHSSRRIVPLPSVDSGLVKSKSTVVLTSTEITRPKDLTDDQQLFAAPPAPKLVARSIAPSNAPSNPKVVSTVTEVPAIQAKSLPVPRQVDEHRTLLTAVEQRAEQRLRYASRLAQRGAVYSAREEFVQVLGVMAQSLDNGSLDNGAGEQKHRQALDAGLTALEEADAFAPNGTLPSVKLDMKRIVAGHQTPVLKETDLEKITPLLALQQYYAYAQERLVEAGGHEPVVSRTLYRMGRLQIVMSGGFNGRRTLGGPKAMAFYKAALKIDSKNYIAANELGVLLARYGQPEEARRVLMHSMSVSPQPETYHNLSVVHRTLGNEEASRRAHAQYKQQLASAEQRRKERLTAGVVDENTPVHWVSAAAFTRIPNADAAEALRAAPSMAGPIAVPAVTQPNRISTESNTNQDVAKKGFGLFKPFFLR